MINLTLDHTTYVTAVAGNLGRAISVDGNADLETLTIDANKIDDLSIQLNPDLVTITAGATLLTIGEATATVAIDNNDLTAVKATDNYQAATAGTVDAGVYNDGTSGMKTFKTYLGVAAAAPSASGVKVFFDTISEYSVQGSSATAVYTDTAVPTVAYTASNIYAVAYSQASNAATTGTTILQAVTTAIPVKKDANGVDQLLANGDIITISDGTLSKAFGGTASVSAGTTTVDLLVAQINADTTIAGITVAADRNAYNEQLVTLTYTSSDGVAETTSSTSGVIYFTYGTDPETGAPLNLTTAALAAVNGSGIADALVAAFNLGTHAYVATNTSGVIRIAALVSGTLQKDDSPLAHAFQTLNVITTSASTTKLLAGDLPSVVLQVSAASNLTAVASGFFNFNLGDVKRSGIRVTLKNSSLILSKAMTVVATAAASDALAGNDGADVLGEGFNNLVSGIDITNVANAVGLASTTLTYVAGYSDIEAPVTSTNTAGTTVRVGWLGV